MAIRYTIINGSQKVWMARVAYQGQRKSPVGQTKQQAKEAQLEAAGAIPATVGALLDPYALDLEARGKGADTIGRAKQTKTAMVALTPTLVTAPVSRVRDRE